MWLKQLAPAIADGVPRKSLGAGLGCWVEHTAANASARRKLQPVPAWSLSPESATQRICALMNHSVQEIDMFRVSPLEGFPEPFWTPALEKYIAGGGCPMPIIPPPPPPAPSGPSVGCPAMGWVPEQTPMPAKGGCCTVLDADLKSCPKMTSHESCAKAECAASPNEVKVWKPEDYKHHPFTCCAA